MIAPVFSRREQSARALGIPTDPSSHSLACPTCDGGTLSVRVYRHGHSDYTTQTTAHTDRNREDACPDCGAAAPMRCDGCGDFHPIAVSDEGDDWCASCAAELVVAVAGGVL